MRRKFIAAAILVLLLAAAAGLYFRLALRHAVHEADNQPAAAAPTTLVADRDWRQPPPPGAIVSRLLPVNDLALWQNLVVTATDAGLVIDANPRRVLSAADGMPGARIAALAVFRDLLLAGADGGLAVLDPQSLRSYRFKNPRANRVTCLLSRPDGVFIGTLGGLYFFDGAAIRFAPGFEDRPELAVSALAALGDGIAVGGWDELLIRQGGVIVRVGQPEGLIGPVTALGARGDGLLVGTPLGLWRWERGRPLRPLLPDVSVAGLLVEGDEVAVAALEQGVFRLAGAKARREPAAGLVTRVVRLGPALYALGDQGALTLAAGEWQPPPTPPAPLSDNRLTAVALAPNGLLWLGTFEAGVDVLRPDLTAAAHLLEPAAAAVNCVRFGPGGVTYVGTSRGLLVYSGLTLRQRLTVADGLIGEAVADVLVLPDSTLVIATNRGITFRSGAESRGLYTFHGLANNHVYALARFGDYVAAGTLGGLSLIKDLRVTRTFTMDNSPLRHNWISALAASNSALYVGAFGGGVMALAPDLSWDPLPGPYDRADINQNALLLTGNRLLAGTFGSGIVELYLPTREWSAAERPLPSRNVTGLALLPAAGSNFRLAAATDSGLGVGAPEALQ